MIVLFTDYGLNGPYVGQLELVLKHAMPELRVINLCADVPRQNPKAGAYLLAALARSLPQPRVWLCVVDPGVGTWQDAPVALNLDGRWFIGPDNGLFDVVGQQARQVVCQEISWRPGDLSVSFHGRDLYAPVAAALAQNRRLPGDIRRWTPRYFQQADLAEVIYIDSFGNVMTGLRAGAIDRQAVLIAGEWRLHYAETFAAVAVGTLFWYYNSCGLVEIACNQGRADEQLGLKPGDAITLLSGSAV